MQNQIFEAALGLATPWFVQDVAFDVEQKTLGIRINFVTGSRFAYPGVDGTHPVHAGRDTHGLTLRGTYNSNSS